MSNKDVIDMGNLVTTNNLPPLLTTAEAVRNFLSQRAHTKTNHRTVGFVPTMGALHQGHVSLIKKAHENCDVVLVSIFVNPTQFNNQNDFKTYPKTLDADYRVCKEAGAHAIFIPDYEEMYPDDYTYKILENKWSKILCGAHRPGHFDGVCTVVMKLFNISQPDFAFFGEKDFQQLQIIKNMTQAFFLKTKIVPVSTLREDSGLAMSSRNLKLSPEGKVRAAQIYQALVEYKNSSEKNETRKKEAAVAHLEKYQIQVEYLEVFENRLFIAAFLEGVRLIDNISLQ